MPPVEDFNYTALNHQAGGHHNKKGVRCMLTDDKGNVLKSINDSQSGKNEEVFYNRVFSDEYFNEFCQFLPRFYGGKTVVADLKYSYLKLENLLANFAYPNIMDIKLGRVTYDPFASMEKKIKEEGKFNAQTKIGFRISGMKLYNEESNCYYSIDGRGFRSCTCYSSDEDKVTAYLKVFLGYKDLHNNMSRNVVNLSCADCCHQHQLATHALLQKVINFLKILLKYMENEKRINLFSSSIFIAYDSMKFYELSHCSLHQHGGCFNNCLNNTAISMLSHCCHEKINKLSVKSNLFTNVPKKFVASLYNKVDYCSSIRMIDFGHSFIDMEPNALDENYIFGLKGLLSFLERLTTFDTDKL
ncbi:inositol polyphosphate multikinase isoform X3 [Hydra vulgaris]|uniref:Kinase n=1 Tax=Hydra vulgaris TaxID=6087 RepID=A0ABM4BSD5_HYDVU